MTNQEAERPSASTESPNTNAPNPNSAANIVVEPPYRTQLRKGTPEAMVYPHKFRPGEIDADAVKVLERLHQRGHDAYLVGGGVRDLLLGIRPKDFDVATSARPNEVRQIFRNCRIIGRRFRLAHVVFHGGKIIETATFRKDPGVEQLGSDELEATASVEISLEALEDDNPFRPQVPREKAVDQDLLIRTDNTFGEPHEDAVRRDFTVNGLFYDIESEEVIDFVGGVSDLEKRVIRTIGVPEVRFREDPVRMLRAIKFAARLDLTFSPEVVAAISTEHAELERCAKPRVLEEIFRLLRGGAARRSVALLAEHGMLQGLLPQVSAYLEDAPGHTKRLLNRLAALDEWVKTHGAPSDAVLLSSLLYDTILAVTVGSEDPAREYEELMGEITQQLSLPRKIKDRVRAIIGTERRIAKNRAAKFVDRDFFGEALAFHKIVCAGEGRAPQPVPEAREAVRRDPAHRDPARPVPATSGNHATAGHQAATGERTPHDAPRNDPRSGPRNDDDGPPRRRRRRRRFG